jgi:1,4-alpha-glucan branching enzyme
MLVFERAGLLFIFNCASVLPAAWARLIPPTVHPSESFVDYRVGVETPGKYKIILNSDEKRFGGHDRVDMKGEYFTTDFPWNDRKNFLQVSCSCRCKSEAVTDILQQVYIPARVVLVLGPA